MAKTIYENIKKQKTKQTPCASLAIQILELSDRDFKIPAIKCLRR